MHIFLSILTTSKVTRSRCLKTPAFSFAMMRIGFPIMFFKLSFVINNISIYFIG